METIMKGYKGLILLIRLNSDTILSVVITVVGLLGGALIGKALVGY